MNLLTSQNGALNEIITPGVREEATLSSWKEKKSSLCIKYIFTIRLFPKACVKVFVISCILIREWNTVKDGLLKISAAESIFA